MFSHLTRGYGTWKGIAKLEKPESAFSPIANELRSDNFILPPINCGKQVPLYEPLNYGYNTRATYTDNIQLPRVDKHTDIIDIPKTYTTKSGALLLYSEACFVPGSRRLKKRPKRRTRKEKKVNTLKDLRNLIMDYKKNECDPLLLEHLWRRSNNSGRDLRPGFSPQRYLSVLLESSTLEEEDLRRLLETGSLKSFGEPTKGFLPSLHEHGQYNGRLLHQRPQPYTTMSLPPVSPSSSMLGSYTFYKHGMSTGAASMVSTDDQYSVKTSATNTESLSARLAEVEPDTGFKQSYESLSPQEKEDLLTQLLMDITLHNASDLTQQIPQNSPVDTTTMSTLTTNASKSLSSIDGYKSLTDSSKSVGMLQSDSKSTICSSVCSLPPINGAATTSQVGGGDDEAGGDDEGVGISEMVNTDGQNDHLSSSSGSGLTITQDSRHAVDIDAIDFEITEDMIGLDDAEKQVLNRKSSEETSHYSLVSALDVKDGDEIREWQDDVTSIQSFGADSGHFSHSDTGGTILPTAGTWPDGDGLNTVPLESDGNGAGDPENDSEQLNNHTHDTSNGSLPQVPHISLGSLQDEVKLVAGDVLARPHSGQSLTEDAKVATHLLMARIERLLGPVNTNVIRVSSARPRKLRPLGQVRNSKIDKHRRVNTHERNIKSANPKLTALKQVKEQLQEDDVVPSKTYAEPETREERENREPASPSKDISNKTEDIEEGISLDEIVIATNEVNESKVEFQKTETKEPSFTNLTAATTIEQASSIEIPSSKIIKSVKKAPSKKVKGKKAIVSKKNNAAKQKTKKKVAAQAKTPPFHAGVVPQQKPPKGLDGGQEKNEKQSPDLGASIGSQQVDHGEMLTSSPAPSTVQSTNKDGSTIDTKTMSSVATTPALSTKLDLSMSGKSSSLDNARKSASSLNDGASHEQMSSPREQTPSPREQTPSSREQTPSPREQTPSPREQTPSPREQTSGDVSPTAVEVAPTESQTEEAEANETVVDEKTKRINARAAQRAAAAERRRLEVERKRREREESRRRALEEEARLEQVRIEAEEEMKKRQEERRIQREQGEAEKKRLEAQERERIERERLAVEREKVVRDEWCKKKEQIIAQRKLEEEMRKERERLDLEMEEQQRREYEERLAHLEDEERERLLEERRLEEERIRREIEEERVRREEERQRMLEERLRMEEEFELIRQRQLERQAFLESLWKEYNDILLEQRTSKAFTFSYFDYLPWFRERFSDLDDVQPESSALGSISEENKDMESEILGE